jgi:hypothetical protein
MTTKNLMLLALIVLLGSISLYLNRDWFAPDNIHIMHRSRPARGAFRRPRSDNPLIDPISFWFDRKLRLTSLKVVPLADVQTNKYPQPLWYLISDSNSAPIKQFTYGMRIPGMHPALKGTVADLLEPGVKYRVSVEAGKQKANHDFMAEPSAGNLESPSGRWRLGNAKSRRSLSGQFFSPLLDSWQRAKPAASRRSRHYPDAAAEDLKRLAPVRFAFRLSPYELEIGSHFLPPGSSGYALPCYPGRSGRHQVE